jgi:hypothetical protein
METSPEVKEFSNNNQPAMDYRKIFTDAIMEVNESDNESQGSILKQLPSFNKVGFLLNQVEGNKNEKSPQTPYLSF